MAENDSLATPLAAIQGPFNKHIELTFERREKEKSTPLGVNIKSCQAVTAQAVCTQSGRWDVLVSLPALLVDSVDSWG